MLQIFREKIAAFVAPERSRRLYTLQQDLGNLAKNIDWETNRRVAEIVSKMDPFEPLMKQFHGIFSEEFQHPEEKLDTSGKLTMYMMGHRIAKDPHFKYLTDWIANGQGNATLKAKGLTRENAADIMLYGRAQISTITLLLKELGRLGSNYEEILAKQEEGAFTSTNTVE